MEEIKKLLCVDVGSASLSGPTGLILIQEKARNFYEDGKKKHGEESGGTSLTLATAVSSVQVYSQSSQCLSTDCKTVAAHEFPENASRNYWWEAYSPEQVFNVGETGLY